MSQKITAVEKLIRKLQVLEVDMKTISIAKIKNTIKNKNKEFSKTRVIILAIHL